jgi:hypothetical protein
MVVDPVAFVADTVIVLVDVSVAVGTVTVHPRLVGFVRYARVRPVDKSGYRIIMTPVPPAPTARF